MQTVAIIQRFREMECHKNEDRFYKVLRIVQLVTFILSPNIGLFRKN